MKTRRPLALGMILALSTPSLVSAQLAPPAPVSLATGFAPAVQAKPLSNQVERGLAFLVAHQGADGGWGQGEESSNMGGSMGHLAEASNVADTCIALLSIMRAGSSGKSGRHTASILRGLDFVMGKIERSDADSLTVTDVNGTRVQGKLGPHIDTFLSSMLLAEAKGQMPHADAESRLDRALIKVVHKIERNQRADGTFENQGWAPVLAQAVAGKGMNRAAQKGSKVSEASRKKFEDYAKAQHDGASQSFGGEGSAGVALYAAAASVGTLSESANTRGVEKEAAAEIMKASPAPASAVAARETMEAADKLQLASDAAQSTLVKNLDNAAFVSGFGSNGGEEFLSYMLVSESLITKGGKDWKDWDTSMTNNLNRVQNADGSFSGHHCITGRTFVTGAALLVLTADRAPMPLASKIRRG